ncbi:unnamed protein product [Spirodela intermedia]|uniref:Uncharacterized protein n=1 Tax=Spirodela intermedia TaxID=51605 RepID=A0A7I8LAJ6_SPIIN|nr:unnamed protein product [Spirodela intermedia]
MWSRVISRREQHPLSAIVSSSSSHSICSTFLTPASPSAAKENRTGLPICIPNNRRWGDDQLTNTPEAPSASALKTSVPRRTPPSRNTGTWPCAAFTTCKWATTARSTTAATQLEWRLVREKVG